MAAGNREEGGAVERDDLLIPVFDETVSGIRFRSADASEPRPTVLMYTPYHNDDLITYGSYYPSIEYLAREGYDVVAADMVGTGASTGTIRELFDQREGEEAAAVVEWLADQKWSTGRVGMFGKSYGGITALHAAANQPESLDAIVPIEAPYQGYKNGYITPGAFEFFGIGGEWLPFQQLLDAKPPTRRDSEGRWKDVWTERLAAVRERDPWLFQFLDHEAKDQYWLGKDVSIGHIRTPTFAIGGYRDGPYTEETFEYFDQIDASKRLLMGPWRHIMPHRGREVAVNFRQQMVEWFDYFLKDEDNGALDRAEITYWTEFDGGGKRDAGVWRGRTEWPTYEDSESLTFALSAMGLVPGDEFESGTVEDRYEYDQTVGIDSAEEIITADLEPVDTGPDDLRSLTYASDPLTNPIEYTGTGAVTVRIRPTTDDPNFAVRLVDVSPEGDSRLVSYGHRRLRYRNGATDPEPVRPGEEYTVTVPLKPKSHVFEPGHRLRLAFSASFFPLVMPTRGQGSFVVCSTPTAASTLRLPGTELENDGDFGFDPIPMDGPDTAVPLESQYVSDGSTRLTTSRERVQNRATVRANTSSSLDLPHAHVESKQEISASVHADDPTTTVLRSEPRMIIDYGAEIVEIDATTRLTLDTVHLRTTVTIDGDVYFEERWSR